ncbi:hypothetical protein L195_g048193 [Trifolium pratense]|uniref:Uncharacterized protein n=1 Tax=Trifolium pratense TaxID=57577 RepID=A0A2K3JKK6_TRIPR|nr:hypothetical protein L195_g048193 [Trifolium pratense]
MQVIMKEPSPTSSATHQQQILQEVFGPPSSSPILEPVNKPQTDTPRKVPFDDAMTRVMMMMMWRLL